MLITDVELTSPDPGRAAHRYADLLGVTPTIFADRAELVVGSSRLLIVAGGPAQAYTISLSPCRGAGSTRRSTG